MARVDGIQYRIDALKRAKGTLYGAFWYVDETSLERAKEWDKTWGGKLGVNDPFVYGRDWYVDASNRKFVERQEWQDCVQCRFRLFGSKWFDEIG